MTETLTEAPKEELVYILKQVVKAGRFHYWGAHKGWIEDIDKAVHYPTKEDAMKGQIEESVVLCEYNKTRGVVIPIQIKLKRGWK